MKKIHLLLLSIISGALLSVSWPEHGFPLFMFIAFVPLLMIEDHILKNRYIFVKSSVFFYTLPAFLIWNGLLTYWIWWSTEFGAIMAVLLNSVFMSLAFQFYHFSRKRIARKSGGYFILILYWIAFEFGHMNWDLTWSWMNLGNAFACFPKWVQWYEFTGAFGGAVWILLVNILLFYLVNGIREKKIRRSLLRYALPAFFIVLIPIIISVIMYRNYEEKSDPVKIVVVQPNIDPWNDKFSRLTSEEQIHKIIRLSRQKVDAGTDLLIGPETAIPEGIWETQLEFSRSIDSLKLLISDYPQLDVLIGMSSYRMYEEGDEPSATARQWHLDSTMYYDVYNTGLFLDSTGEAQLYHKSILVPGVEKMPFPGLLKPLEKFALDLGGMTGSHGIQEERTPFVSKSGKKYATAICYESIYGGFLTGFYRNGANLLCIITNDGWWKDTPGYRQHFQYARLRAIESRRSVARSANTGRSGFINQKGDILQQTNWWEDDVITETLNFNDEMTFYARYGDYLGRTAAFASLLLLLISFTSLFIKKKS